MIVLADADLERAANAATYYSMQNGGQTCVSVERVYVEAPIYDRFVDAVTERVKALRVGPPSPASVEVGAITFGPQLEAIADHVSRARRAPASPPAAACARGGAVLRAVLADVDHSMTAMTEETFGPTVPIMKVADAEEAIRLANDSPYGLGASVWTKDRARGEQIARRLESATCVNDANVNYFAFELPMGGWKDQASASATAPPGIRKYTRQQAILVRFAPKRELHYFPYRAGTTRLLVGSSSCSAPERLRAASRGARGGAPVEPVDARDRQQLVAQEGVVAVEAAADHRLRPVQGGRLEPQDLEQLRQPAAAHQMPLQALDRGQVPLHVGARAPEERDRLVEERRPVLVVALGQGVRGGSAGPPRPRSRRTSAAGGRGTRNERTCSIAAMRSRSVRSSVRRCVIDGSPLSRSRTGRPGAR